MRYVLLVFLYLLSGCATKYLVPGNRFITPETQGGAFRGQIELQQASATQATIDTEQGTVTEGVKYSEVDRFGFLFSNSLFDSFDLIWSHTGGSTSMLGGKLQFLGSPRTGNGAGYKLSAAALFGGNEHETDDKSVEFELAGKEVLILYGYRVNQFVLPYSSFSYASYDFSGKIKSKDPVLNGLRPETNTKTMGLSAGLEITLDSFFGKLEATYQQLSTTDTKERSELLLGYSLGFSW